MNNFISYFKVGKCYNTSEIIDFKVTSFKDLINNIIPFFDKYKIVGEKAKTLRIFKKVAQLMKK